MRVDPKALRNDQSLRTAIQNLQSARSAEQLDQAFSRLNTRDDRRLTALNLDRVSGRFQTQLQSNRYDTLIRSRVGQQFNLNRQFRLFSQGDVTRQLRLNTALINGGWQARHTGLIYSNYSQSAFSWWYPGPSWYPAYAWTPYWSPWVQWSFWDTVLPIYDPRPFAVRPYYFDAAPVVTTFDYPVWQELPVIASGTWVEVPSAPVARGSDLQLLAVRFVDPGHREEDLGPRYRIWLRNNSEAPLKQNFDVTVFASNDKELSDQVVQAGVTIPEVAADDTIAIDVRLPADANRLFTDKNQDRVPFRFLHVVVDSGNDIKEDNEENNGAVLSRSEIFPVDPAAFSTNVTAAAPGSTIAVAGEGLGPEPGEVIVSIGDEQHSAEISGWYDLGVQIIVPKLDVNDAEHAQILIIRGDGAASNPVALDIAPEDSIGTLSQTSTSEN
jgi:hypothetical protein